MPLDGRMEIDAGDVDVLHRRLDVGVAREPLHNRNRHAGLNPPGDEGVPQRVEREIVG